VLSTSIIFGTVGGVKPSVRLLRQRKRSSFLRSLSTKQGTLHLGFQPHILAECVDYFGNYWWLGHESAALGRWREALNAVRSALDNAPSDLDPEASESIQLLLRQCEEALKRGVHDDIDDSR